MVWFCDLDGYVSVFDLLAYAAYAMISSDAGIVRD